MHIFLLFSIHFVLLWSQFFFLLTNTIATENTEACGQTNAWQKLKYKDIRFSTIITSLNNNSQQHALKLSFPQFYVYVINTHNFFMIHTVHNEKVHPKTVPINKASMLENKIIISTYKLIMQQMWIEMQSTMILCKVQL